MTYQQGFPIPAKVLEQIVAQGLEGLPGPIGMVVNPAMQLEQAGFALDTVFASSGASIPHQTNPRIRGARHQITGCNCSPPQLATPPPRSECGP